MNTDVKARESYEQIRNAFGIFVDTWKTKNTSALDAVADKEIINYMSVVKA